MFKRFFESFTTITGSWRGDALGGTGVIVKRAVIAYRITGDQSYPALGEIVLAFREQLADQQQTPDGAVQEVLDIVLGFGEQIKRVDDKHGIADRITAACLVPHGAPSANYTHGEKYGTKLSSRELESFRAAIVANDHQRGFWSDAEVLSEQSRFGFNGLPSIDWLVDRYGEEALRAVVKDMVGSRTKIANARGETITR